ncbi:transposable element Tcb1 transposase [Trichonephila clavipes]|nr:transposable element Tcb1 transposase [Trichonephila clavipes]
MTFNVKVGSENLVNPETVRSLSRNHKYQGRVPQKKPCIIKANRQARLAFAKRYARQTTEYCENVIFVDETKYSIFESDGKQKVWRKSNTKMHVKNLRLTIKYGEGNQIVRGCIASSDVRNLHFIDGIMNKYVYIS